MTRTMSSRPRSVGSFWPAASATSTRSARPAWDGELVKTQAGSLESWPPFTMNPSAAPSSSLEARSKRFGHVTVRSGWTILAQRLWPSEPRFL
jgi:hypothetical protein